MDKKVIKLTEGDLHEIVKETIQKILKEDDGVETGIEFYDNQRENYRGLNNIRNLQSKAVQVLNELFEACEGIPSEKLKMHLRPSVTVALEKIQNMFPQN